MAISAPRNKHLQQWASRAAMTMLLALPWVAGLAAAVELRVEVGAAAPGDLEGTVVSLHAIGRAPETRASTAVMDQRASRFVPRVLPVQVGAKVSFPNNDRIRHQVYSFSEAKPFELPLYAGASLPPVEFDKPGVVVVGCNIHDAMIGYVVVLDTPYFGRAGLDGQVLIDAPPGRYRMQTWHARLNGAALQKNVVLEAGRPQQLRISLDLPAAQRLPGNGRMRALQDKLRRMQARP